MPDLPDRAITHTLLLNSSHLLQGTPPAPRPSPQAMPPHLESGLIVRPHVGGGRIPGPTTTTTPVQALPTPLSSSPRCGSMTSCALPARCASEMGGGAHAALGPVVTAGGWQHKGEEGMVSSQPWSISSTAPSTTVCVAHAASGLHAVIIHSISTCVASAQPGTLCALRGLTWEERLVAAPPSCWCTPRRPPPAGRPQVSGQWGPHTPAPQR